MFGFLKDKLKKAVEAFTKDVDEESEVVEAPEEDIKEDEIKKEDLKEEKEQEDEKPAAKKETGKIKEKKPEEKKPEKKEKKEKAAKDTDKKEKDEKDRGEKAKDEIKAADRAFSDEELEKENAGKKDICSGEEKDEDNDVKETVSDNEDKDGLNHEDEPAEEAPKKGFFSRLKDRFRKKDEEEPEAIEKDRGISEEKEDSGEDTEEISENGKAEDETKGSTKGDMKYIGEEFTKEDIRYIKEELPTSSPEHGREEITEKAEEEAIIKEETGKKPEEDRSEEKHQEEQKPGDKKGPDKKREPDAKKGDAGRSHIEKKKRVVLEDDEPENKGFFSKLAETVTKSAISEEKFNDLFWELELVLLENNVALEVIEKIKEDLKSELVHRKVRRGSTEEIISGTLSRSIEGLFDVGQIDLIAKAKAKKPYVIAFIGVNGSGKTTTIAKVAKLFQDNGIRPVMAAADTFRAAAIQQLEEHANNLGVKLIRHDYGSDPAAVAFDAVKYAESGKADVVLIDTAGRLHSNSNLMDEMKKIIRISKPDIKIFIGESITGNDCVEQAKQFDAAVGIDGIILAKADVDEKGGAAISVSYVTGKPILYLGTGQGYDDLKEFSPELIVESVGL